MTLLQLSLNFQNKQNKETTVDTKQPTQTKEKNNNKTYQNTKNPYKSISLKEIKNSNYILTTERYLDNPTEESSKLKPTTKTEIEKQINELKKLIEEEEKSNNLISEILSKIAIENANHLSSIV